MNFTLNQLQIFLKITQTNSVTKAAEELHLTQPAISIQLKNFQNQFDIPLTELIGRKIFITDFGKEIAATAEKILSEVYNINFKTLAHNGHLTGRIKISIVSTGKYVMPYFITDFMKQNEGVELVMDVTNKAKVIESLEKNEVDFSLVSILPEKLKIEKIELMQNKLFLIGSGKTKMTKQALDKSEFENLPFIYREKGSGTRINMEKYFEKNNFSVKKKMELTSNEAVKQAVIAGLGYSIMPLIGIKNELQNGELQIIHKKGLPLKSVWNLIWNKGKKFSPAAIAFLNHLKKEKAKIITHHFDWFEKY